MKSKTERVAIVTGAAAGIGQATAIALARAGCALVVADIDADGAAACAQRIRDDGHRAFAVTVDVTIEGQVKAMVDFAVNEFGGVDILHNNAGTALRSDQTITDLADEDWLRTMAINAGGTMYGCKHVLPVMLDAGSGVIVNTASVSGMSPELLRPAYGAAKAAVISLTRHVASAYGKRGIRCVAVCPGIILSQHALDVTTPAWRDGALKHHMSTRLGEPADIANFVVYAASEGAGFLNGAIVPVDGGFSCHLPNVADDLLMQRHG